MKNLIILLLILFVIENTTMAWSGAKVSKRKGYIHKCPKKKKVITNGSWGMTK